MIVRGMVDKILLSYGSIMTLHHDGQDHRIRACFQPVRSKSWDASDSNYSPLGEIPRGRYIYLGPLDPEAVAGDTIQRDDRQFLVRRSELVYDQKGPAYCWALCLEKGGEDHWGRQS